MRAPYPYEVERDREAQEMADEHGRITVHYGDGWRVTAQWTRPWSKRRSRPQRDWRRQLRKRMRGYATMRQLLAAINERAELREIEAALDELVAEGTAIKTPDGFYMASPAKGTERREWIARWWNAGYTHPEIARALGTTEASITTTIYLMRRAGYDLVAHPPGRRRTA